MTAATGAFENTAIGRDALKALTIGDYNTALGSKAGIALTDGINNVILGQVAGIDMTGSNSNVIIGFNSADALTTGGGNVIIGQGTVSSGGSADGQVTIGNGLTGKNPNTAFIGGSSGAYNEANNSSWSTTSDRRIKKNIEDNTTGLDAINGLRIRNFEYRTKDEVTDFDNPNQAVVEKEGIQVGVIAQEIEEVLPNVVKTLDSGVKSVEPDNITWYLVNAVKELSAKVEELEDKLK